MTSATDPREMLRRIEDYLWVEAKRIYPEYVRGRYDCWAACPREHAVAHLRCIVELSAIAFWNWPALELLRQVGRSFPGDDLVFAVGDIQ